MTYLDALRNRGGAGLSRYERKMQLEVLVKGTLGAVACMAGITLLGWIVLSWFCVLLGPIAGWNFFLLLSR